MPRVLRKQAEDDEENTRSDGHPYLSVEQRYFYDLQSQHDFEPGFARVLSIRYLILALSGWLPDMSGNPTEAT
jgi:hypothetical protein